MKAVVMETKRRKAVILLKDGTFHTVHGHYAVGEIIDYTVRPSRRWLPAAAAAIIMLGSGIGGSFLYDSTYTVYGEVSMDAQPSIVFTVNKKNQVLSVLAANEDAKSIVDVLNAENTRFMPISGAVEKAMAVLAEEGFLEESRKDFVLLGVSADDTNREELFSEVQSGMEKAAGEAVEYKIEQTDRETARRAAENNMTAGKYTAWETAGDGSTPAEYAAKSIQEIMNPPGSEPLPEKREGSDTLDAGDDAPLSLTEPVQPDADIPSSPPGLLQPDADTQPPLPDSSQPGPDAQPPLPDSSQADPDTQPPLPDSSQAGTGLLPPGEDEWQASGNETPAEEKEDSFPEPAAFEKEPSSMYEQQPPSSRQQSPAAEGDQHPGAASENPGDPRR